MTENDQYRDGTEQRITVSIEDFEDCRKAGKQTQNELYRQFSESDSGEFELIIRSVDSETNQSKSDDNE